MQVSFGDSEKRIYPGRSQLATRGRCHQEVRSVFIDFFLIISSAFALVQKMCCVDKTRCLSFTYLFVSFQIIFIHHSFFLLHRNEFDLEEARILRNKTKKRYESYLAELEAAETKRVATLEGIVRAKALSVAASATYVPYFHSFLICIVIVFGCSTVWSCLYRRYPSLYLLV